MTHRCKTLLLTAPQYLYHHAGPQHKAYLLTYLLHLLNHYHSSPGSPGSPDHSPLLFFTYSSAGVPTSGRLPHLPMLWCPGFGWVSPDHLITYSSDFVTHLSILGACKVQVGHPVGTNATHSIKRVQRRELAANHALEGRAACHWCVARHARTRTLALSGCVPCHRSCVGERCWRLLRWNCMPSPARVCRLQHDQGAVLSSGQIVGGRCNQHLCRRHIPRKLDLWRLLRWNCMWPRPRVC